MPKSLTNTEVSVNNLTLATDGKKLRIKTKGEWTGTMRELLLLIKELGEEHEG